MKKENFERAKEIESTLLEVNKNIEKLEELIQLAEKTSSKKPEITIKHDGYTREAKVSAQSFGDYVSLELKKEERYKVKLQKEFESL